MVETNYDWLLINHQKILISVLEIFTKNWCKTDLSISLDFTAPMIFLHPKLKKTKKHKNHIKIKNCGCNSPFQRLNFI